MKNLKVLYRVIPFLTAVGVLLWFALGVPHLLHHAEQMQLFLNTRTYFLQSIAHPGGLSEYIAGWFTQFFFFRWMGALAVTLLFALLLHFSRKLFLRLNHSPSVWEPLTWIPALLFVALLCDEYYALSGMTAAVIAMGFSLLYTHIPLRYRFALALLFIPILYWVTGLFVWPALLLMLAFDRLQSGGFRWMASIALIGWTLILPVIGYVAGLPYPLLRLYWGGFFFRSTTTYPAMLYVLCLLLAAAPVVPAFLPAPRRRGLTAFALLASLTLLEVAAVAVFHDPYRERMRAYDYYTRFGRWPQVKALADAQVPSDALSVACLNLSLHKMGLLGDCFMDYPQYGSDGLMPDMAYNHITSMMGGEIYYHLGYVNIARRFAFEAMESNPDGQKSVRSIKRLAEVDIINGSYASARKYLTLLQHTFIYRGWANEALRLIDSEDAINGHREWGALRLLMPREDFLFDPSQKNRMLLRLYETNTRNRMAYEYLMARLILMNNESAIKRYYPLKESIGYRRAPKQFEAVYRSLNLPLPEIPTPTQP